MKLKANEILQIRPERDSILFTLTTKHPKSGTYVVRQLVGRGAAPYLDEFNLQMLLLNMRERSKMKNIKLFTTDADGNRVRKPRRKRKIANIGYPLTNSNYVVR